MAPVVAQIEHLNRIPCDGAKHIFHAMLEDLRPGFFAGHRWYEELEPVPHKPSAWMFAKGADPNVWVDHLNAGLTFAVEHGLAGEYRARFGGISLRDLDHDRAHREHRTCVSPILEIANELLVARYLERVHGWLFRAHEPQGRRGRKGDWQFTTPRGREVFVEVATVREPQLSTGVFNANFSPRLRSEVAHEYKHLPLDDRAVLLVLVGGFMLGLPAQHPELSHLFAALFGDWQITFQVLPYKPETVRAGPSFREMVVHRKKHRRLGCVAALCPGGLDVATCGFYAIHNPWAHDEVRLAREDFGDSLQFTVDDDGRGRWAGDLHPPVWERMSESA
jgi:hypothetical protein